MIRVETLGGLRVSTPAEERSALPAKPLRAAMLVYLVVEGESTRERLCNLFWGDSDPRRARRSLSQTLLELRKELGDGWVEVAGQALRTTEQITSDVAELVRYAEAGDPQGVVDTYAGPFLHGVDLGGGVDFERWIDTRRTDLHRTVRAALRELTEGSVAPERLVEITRRWVELDPLDDEAQHALIEALASAGHRGAALAQYDGYRELIAAELDLTPLEHTDALVERIKAGDVGTASNWVQDTAPPNPSAGGHGSTDRTIDDPGPFDRVEYEREDETVPTFVKHDLKVIRRLAEGSTGPVYLARQPPLRRSVAVKVLSAELAAYPAARARFEREARLAARLRHPNVAHVYDFGSTEEDLPYFIMPYLRGVTLADHVRANGPCSPERTRRVVADIASALAAAHAADVIHRDVRPANVMYDEESDHVDLLDFGIAAVLVSADEERAQLTRSGELLGNPAYISPEQALGEPLTDRSDVYSLGVLGWELLLGRAVPRDVAAKSPDLGDPQLIDVLRRATAKKPRHRPSAVHIADVLGRPPADDGRGGGLIEKLMRRRMPQWVAAYLAGGFAVMEGVDQLVQQTLLAPIAYLLALVLYVAGLNAVVVVTWFHGGKGPQRVPRSEIALLTLVFVGWLLATLMVFGRL